MTKPSEILHCAAERVRKGWTQNAYARNAKRQEVSSKSEDAVRFCALGALARCASEEGCANRPPHWDAERALENHLQIEFRYFNGVAPWNDKRGQKAEKVADTLEAVAEKLSKENK